MDTWYRYRALTLCCWLFVCLNHFFFFLRGCCLIPVFFSSLWSCGVGIWCSGWHEHGLWMIIHWDDAFSDTVSLRTVSGGIWWGGWCEHSFCWSSVEILRSRTLYLFGLVLWKFDETDGMGILWLTTHWDVVVFESLVSLDLCDEDLTSWLVWATFLLVMPLRCCFSRSFHLSGLVLWEFDELADFSTFWLITYWGTADCNRASQWHSINLSVSKSLIWAHVRRLPIERHRISPEHLNGTASISTYRVC